MASHASPGAIEWMRLVSRSASVMGSVVLVVIAERQRIVLELGPTRGT
jgi:hypothetical protein